MTSANSPPPLYISGHPTSFAQATDPTLHRHGWRSPKARTEEPLAPSRKVPVRYRALLRYDALLPPSSPITPGYLQSGCHSARRPSPPRIVNWTPRSARSPSRIMTAPPPPTPTSSVIEDLGTPSESPRTDLGELKWFQHRWMDKHGKDSHLKESREKMALLRRWFESLDADGSGEVGLDELEDPLVSVGLARSRDEVQRLIDQVDKDGSGEITFHEFLNMMNPKKPKRAAQRQPLHKAKAPHQPPVPGEHDSSKNASDAAAQSKQPSHNKTQSSSANPVAKLFEDLQSGKLGDLTIPFPVLITAYRRRMLLNAHMAEDPVARRLGSSVLQALECTRRDSPSRHSIHRRTSTFGLENPPASVNPTSQTDSSPSSYLKSYVSSAEAADESSRSTGQQSRRKTSSNRASESRKSSVPRASIGAAATQLPSL